MNHLLIYMHPSENSFNGAIMNELTSVLTEYNENVAVTRLFDETDTTHLTINEYSESLKGIYPQKVRNEHEKIAAADRLFFVFPVWWGGFPSIGKAYLDRHLSYGFAYELEGESPIPLLSGKKVSLIFTTGAPEAVFNESGMYDHMVSLLDKSIFQFCGLELDGVLHFGDVIQRNDNERKRMLKSVRQFAAGIIHKD